MNRVACIAFVLLGLAGCGGEGAPCRKSDECHDDLECSGPNDGPVCGIGPMQACGRDEDCFDQRCHVVGDGCSESGIGSSCGPACTDDSTCEIGTRCNAAGACEAIPCTEGFVCPSHQECDPDRITAETPVWDRHHGCFDVACDGDGDCGGELVCVNAICQTAVGTCSEVMLVP